MQNAPGSVSGDRGVLAPTQPIQTPPDTRVQPQDSRAHLAAVEKGQTQSQIEGHGQQSAQMQGQSEAQAQTQSAPCAEGMGVPILQNLEQADLYRKRMKRSKGQREHQATSPGTGGVALTTSGESFDSSASGDSHHSVVPTGEDGGANEGRPLEGVPLSVGEQGMQVGHAEQAGQLGQTGPPGVGPLGQICPALQDTSKHSSSSSNEMVLDFAATASAVQEPKVKGFKKYLKERYLQETRPPPGTSSVDSPSSLASHTSSVSSNECAPGFAGFGVGAGSGGSGSLQAHLMGIQQMKLHLGERLRANEEMRHASSGTEMEDDEVMKEAAEQEQYRSSLSSLQIGRPPGRLGFVKETATMSGSGTLDLSQPLLSPLLRTRIASTDSSNRALAGAGVGAAAGTTPGSPTVNCAFNSRSHSYSFHSSPVVQSGVHGHAHFHHHRQVHPYSRPQSSGPSGHPPPPAAEHGQFSPGAQYRMLPAPCEVEFRSDAPKCSEISSTATTTSRTVKGAGAGPAPESPNERMRLTSTESDVFFPSSPVVTQQPQQPAYVPQISQHAPPSPSPLVKAERTAVHHTISSPGHLTLDPHVGQGHMHITLDRDPHGGHFTGSPTHSNKPQLASPLVLGSNGGCGGYLAPGMGLGHAPGPDSSLGSTTSPSFYSSSPRGGGGPPHDVQSCFAQTSGISSNSCAQTRDSSLGSYPFMPGPGSPNLHSPMHFPPLPEQFLFISQSAPGTPQRSPHFGSTAFVFPPPSAPFSPLAAQILAQRQLELSLGAAGTTSAQQFLQTAGFGLAAANSQSQPQLLLSSGQSTPSGPGCFQAAAAAQLYCEQLMALQMLNNFQAFANAAGQSSANSGLLHSPQQHLPPPGHPANFLVPQQPAAASAGITPKMEPGVCAGAGQAQFGMPEGAQGSPTSVGAGGGTGPAGANRVHLCPTCGRIFSRSDMLTRHLRLHSGTSTSGILGILPPAAYFDSTFTFRH